MTRPTRRTFCELTATSIIGLVSGACNSTPGNGDSESGKMSDKDDESESSDDESTESDTEDSSSEDSESSTEESESSTEDSETSSSSTDDESTESDTEESSSETESDDPTETTDSDTTESEDTSSEDEDTFPEDDRCEESYPQAEGPYPAPGLERENLDLYGHPGDVFVLTGKVLDSNCDPIPDAKVLIWHSTPTPPGERPKTWTEDPSYTPAVYDHSAMAGEKTPDGQNIPTGEQMYYGWVRTDEEGRYRFITKRPGWYLDFGGTYRTSHIHAKIYVGNQQKIVTQIYFPDDDFNPNDAIYKQCQAAGADVLIKLVDSENGTYNFQV